MLRNRMATGMHFYEASLSGTREAWLAARGITARQGSSVSGAPVEDQATEVQAIPDNAGTQEATAPPPTPHSPPIGGRKWRHRRPLRMTPKAQRRRWFRKHNRRMRALALRKMREAEEPCASDPPAVN